MDLYGFAYRWSSDSRRSGNANLNGPIEGPSVSLKRCFHDFGRADTVVKSLHMGVSQHRGPPNITVNDFYWLIFGVPLFR